MFEFGFQSKFDDLSALLLESASSSKISDNIRATIIWLLGKLVKSLTYCGSIVPNLSNLLFKILKSSEAEELKVESLGALNRILKICHPEFHDKIGNLFKIIMKDKFMQHKKLVIKVVSSSIFYIKTQKIGSVYEQIINFSKQVLSEESSELRTKTVNCLFRLLTEKVFCEEVDLNALKKIKITEVPKHFVEFLIAAADELTEKSSSNCKVSLCQLIEQLLKFYKQWLNSNEENVKKMYNLLLAYFPVYFRNLPSNFDVYFDRLGDKPAPFIKKNENNTEILSLYRTYVQSIYNVSYREILFFHVIEKITHYQNKLEKLENTKNSKADIQLEYNINGLLFTLCEFAENQSEIFENKLKSFNELNDSIMLFYTTSIRSIRSLVTRLIVTLSYSIPSWRNSILAVFLNSVSAFGAEVASYKNVCL